MVQQERDKINTELLKKEIAQLKEELEESDTYIEQLEKKLEETRNTKATAKENLGEVFSLALENMIRRNTHLLGGIPLVGQSLAGVVEQDNKRLEEAIANSPQAIEERQVTFKKMYESEKPTSSNTISKEDQDTLDYFNSLRQAFTEPELLQVLEIISTLSYTKECIPSVLDLLKEEGEGETENSQATDEDLKENAARF